MGTLPFVYLGSQWYGALGVLYGQALGNVLFGLLGILVLRYHIAELMQGSEVDHGEEDVSIVSLNTQPFCSHDAVLIDDVSANREECVELKQR
ncbi:hypothetical protein A6D96_03440 [Vibrio cyclitrophicus]|nr:hypothetical protein A6D96_03440 [Vibrio cyclitrophicus]